MRNGNGDLSIEEYHRRTKHGYGRFAAGPRFLDWATQPFPFRLWAGSPAVELPFETLSAPASFHTLHAAGAIPPQEADRESLGLFWALALGLTAVKEQGGVRWALRANPSSGNLHPTEGYLVWPGGGGVPAGVHHYQPRDHLLEGRTLLPPGTVLPWKGFFAALSSIAWREAWKYGERAYRYVLLDAGHALASLRYAAAVLGWSVTVDGRWGDAEGERLQRLDRERDFRSAEGEGLELLAWVSPGQEAPPSPEDVLASLRGVSWKGQANRLSAARTPWEAVEGARAAARIPSGGDGEPPFRPPRDLPAPKAPSRNLRAVEVIRSRRSGVAYDGKTPTAREAFFRMADALLPRPGVPPFDALPWPPRVHALFFLHRVAGLEPGLYLLPRRREAREDLRRRLEDSFLYQEVEGAPAHLGLRRLRAGDLRKEARFLSCNQEIASDSAFAVSLVAEFGPVLKDRPWAYRFLHYEAGAVGQALYLWAEAEGFRGTGIGCFYDDEVHRLLGIRGNDLQVLYHFTVGTPLEDRRLATLPPYGHLPPERRP
jgi:nitroreductase